MHEINECLVHNEDTRFPDNVVDDKLGKLNGK